MIWSFILQQETILDKPIWQEQQVAFRINKHCDQ